MANEIYNTSWWGTALDTARTAGTDPDFFGSQMKLLTSEQDNLVTSWTNRDFSAFTSSDSTITEMVSSGSGNNCYSSISFKQGNTYKIDFICSQNITVQIRISNNNNLTSAQVVLNNPLSGLNSFTFTANANYSYIGFYAPVAFANTQITNFNSKLVRLDLDQIEAKKCLADWIHVTALQDLNN